MKEIFRYTQERNDREVLRDDILRENDDFNADDELEPGCITFDLDELLQLEHEDMDAIGEYDPIIPEAFVPPLNLNQWNKEGADDDDDWESDRGTERPQDAFVEEEEEQGSVEIDGVEVSFAKAGITLLEMKLYRDPRLGCYRCRYPSPLRKCWTAVVREEVESIQPCG
jgi:hypothetical protein